jgi:hypothetical protein
LKGRLDKVVSTKLSTSSYKALEYFAREYYIKGNLKQPTVSRLVRVIIMRWIRTNQIALAKGSVINIGAEDANALSRKGALEGDSTLSRSKQ